MSSAREYVSSREDSDLLRESSCGFGLFLAIKISLWLEN
jgi:hypothetical protein